MEGITHSKRMEREKLARDVADFLAKGGKIIQEPATCRGFEPNNWAEIDITGRRELKMKVKK